MSARESCVVLVEDDYYARTWMELLLRRDWRTRVVGEVGSPTDLSSVLEDLKAHNERIDLALIDTDVPFNEYWLKEVLAKLTKFSPRAAVLFTGVAANNKIAGLLASPNFAGYVLKAEICHSLAWAVSLAAEGNLVVTPGVCNLFGNNNAPPRGTLILDGRKPVIPLSKRDQERARMAFIFSMERHELADELGLTDDFSYGMVSELYEKIGLNDVLDGTVEPEQFFGSHPVVAAHVRRTLDHLKRTKSKKAKDKETLAFHLLTLPDIDEIGS